MKKFTQEWWQSLPPERAGKEVENLVKAEFAKLAVNQHFAWHRMPDAAAARGALAAQPGDFLYTCAGTSGFLEVKALKDPRRLPASRLTQLGVLKKFELAGMESYVLVFQYTEGYWRVMPIEQIEVGVPSWLVTEWPGYTDLRLAIDFMFSNRI